MFFKKLYQILAGYLNITIEGFFIERFINLSAASNILLWNGKRKNSSILICNIGIRDFKRIKQIAKETKCRVSINNKKGLPFIFNNYKKRKLFLGMFIFIVLIIIALSNFIWNIELVGCQEIETKRIKEELENYGLKIGAFKNSINTKEIINEVRLNHKDIAWVRNRFGRNKC